MKRLLILSLMFVAFALPAMAQNPPAIGTSTLSWDMAGPDLATVQGYTFKYYPDGNQTGTVIANVTCSGAVSPFACSAPFPAFTPGVHVLVLTANNLAGESPKSEPPFGFVFVVTPATPANIRIK